MTKKEFREMCENEIVVLDGATGSNLQKTGMPFGVCPEQWICEHPQALIRLQQDYIKAGSRIIYAPTFGANRIKLKEYGLEAQTAALNERLVQISKAAAAEYAPETDASAMDVAAGVQADRKSRVLVAGDMTMTGQQLTPLGTLTLAELIDAYKEQAAALAKAGADLIVIETMMRLAETRAALIAVQEVCDLPVMVTMSFGENGKTLYGTDPETAVEVLQALGADAVGINCSAGPDRMLPVLQKMAAHACVPLIAKPNAGLPKIDENGNTVYDMEKEPFASYMKMLVENGAVIVGGCCGTDPSYIELTAASAKAYRQQDPAGGAWKVPADSAKKLSFLTTERMCVPVEEGMVIGHIDPQENEELAEEYREGTYDTLMDLLDEQMDEEADVICLSVDGKEIDGAAIIEEVIEEATQYTNLPLAFTSRDPQILEAALRAYPGRAGVIAGEMASQTVQKLCRKYGAVQLSS